MIKKSTDNTPIALTTEQEDSLCGELMYLCQSSFAKIFSEAGVAPKNKHIDGVTSEGKLIIIPLDQVIETVAALARRAQDVHENSRARQTKSWLPAQKFELSFLELNCLCLMWNALETLRPDDTSALRDYLPVQQRAMEIYKDNLTSLMLRTARRLPACFEIDKQLLLTSHQLAALSKNDKGTIETLCTEMNEFLARRYNSSAVLGFTGMGVPAEKFVKNTRALMGLISKTMESAKKKTQSGNLIGALNDLNLQLAGLLIQSSPFEIITGAFRRIQTVTSEIDELQPHTAQSYKATGI